MLNDPQVIESRSFSEHQSLLDVMLTKYEVSKKDPCNPFLMRVLLCGKHGEQPLHPTLEELASEACTKADMSHLFYASAPDSKGLQSVVIDYGDRFFQLVEGCDRHVYFYLEELKALQEKRKTVDSIIILFFDDDFEKRSGEGWLYIDKIPPASMGNNSVEKSEEEVMEIVLHDLENVLELSGAAIENTGTKRQLFADNAKMNYPRLFPKLDVLNMYMKSDYFFLLREFDEIFCRFPEITREVETNQPADDPLRH